MFTFTGLVLFSIQKNVCYNNLLRSHYTYHKNRLVFILWSQKQRHKPKIKKMLQNAAKRLRSQ